MAGTPCPSCATQNPAEARFCMACGTALPRAARAAASPPRRRGALLHELRRGPRRPPPLPPPPPAPVRSPPAPTALSEERRKVTVLFADLSGYTAIAERWTPRSVKRLIERMPAPARRGGRALRRHVDKYIGDNVMAIFGAPGGARATTPSAPCAPASGCRRRWSEINADGRARQHGVALRAARRRQHRRGARRARGRQLHGDRRQRERRRAPAGGGAPRHGHRRRAHVPRHARGDRLRRAASRSS